MFVRNFCSSCFLQNVIGSQPFRDYCRQRGIAVSEGTSPSTQREDLRQWVVALAQLPGETQAQVELELAQVREMAGHGAITQLLAACEGQSLPAPSIAGGDTLALWFFLHQLEVFNEVFLHNEVQDTEAWWNAQALPVGVLQDLPGKASALAASLRELFQLREGVGRFCAVNARWLNGAYCFVAHVSDRLQFLEVFTEDGEYATQSLLPALPVVFVYYPADGTILLQTRLHSHDRLLELFQVFGRAVLAKELDDHCMGYAFDLERLKERFDPLPDETDMEMIRVKTLHLLYPERHGRRQVKLETITSDEQFAILRLLQAHMKEEGILGQLRVSHAELQVKLKVEGGSKNVLIQLWPNRCNLSQSALHERLRNCLRRWSLYTTHAR